jgi:hypothetical protein
VLRWALLASVTLWTLSLFAWFAGWNAQRVVEATADWESEFQREWVTSWKRSGVVARRLMPWLSLVTVALVIATVA